jgi:opacity protein-like surface antigen
MKKHTLLLAVFASVLSCSAFAYNPYVGLSLGVQDISANDTAFRGLRPGAFLGYGGSIDKDYYIAGEFTASGVLTLNNVYLNRNQSLRMSPYFSLSLLPGMLFSQTAMGYLRVGVADAQLNVSNTWRVGWILGAGIEAALTPCWSVRAEYDYTWYHATGSGTPRSDDFAVSFKYTFDA